MDIMKKNPKGGRPPKSASEKLKERLTVKMAAADYYALRGKARAAGLTWAEYARSSVVTDGLYPACNTNGLADVVFAQHFTGVSAVLVL